MKLDLLKVLQWSPLRGRIVLPIVVVSRFLDFIIPQGVEIGRQRRTLALL
ncbi:hypothetical protein [Paenibacillus sp. SN-8-1]